MTQPETQVDKQPTDIKTSPKKNLFNKVQARKITDTTPVLIKLIAGTQREGIDRRSGQPNYSLFGADGGKLPVIEAEDRPTLKSIVFAHINFAEKTIDETTAGFEDEQGNAYFLMAPQLPNAAKTYWIRELSPYVIEYAQKLRANPEKLQELMKDINEFEI